jgi:nucleotide-binding universal stress UspA family protein
MTKEKATFNKNILIAVDDSENSARAVAYTGRILAGGRDYKMILLHIIPEPEEDFFPSRRDQQRWLARYREKMAVLLEDYRKVLTAHGFAAEDVKVELKLRSCLSLAECILKEGQSSGCDTIVVGRQGLSRSEEFLFGSISSKIVTHGDRCTVWVVE